ncbi:hypothetical protein [Nereida sp. MMG025]|uniref:hypothetical protein n=1 Tax=Nereida sp. MMG025 TaxID=2909981 RepID=UPI001F441BD4|nr:hypothetical protein [Nereida sp. MMG025]MCF6446137.1 hypothetical protein [Nereida sp. MMG025]
MIKRLIGSFIAASFEAVFIVLPGLALAIFLLMSFAGPWYMWMGVGLFFCIYVVVMESLKDRIIHYFDPLDEDSDTTGK